MLKHSCIDHGNHNDLTIDNCSNPSKILDCKLNSYSAMYESHFNCKSLQFGPLLPGHAVVVALAVRLDCNHRYHHNNGEERGRLKCIIKLQREELELVSKQRLRRGLFDCQLSCSLTGGSPLIRSPLV